MSEKSEADDTEDKRHGSTGQAIKMCEHKQIDFNCPDCDAWYWKYFGSGKKGTH